MRSAKSQSGLKPLPQARRPLRGRRALAVAALIALLVAFALDRLFPPPIPAAGHDGATLVLARDGTPLRAFANRAGVWRYPTAPERVSPYYLEALLGYEDRWFDHHPGVNPGALARAAAQALRHGEVVSGGSTLTMQVARLIEPMPRSGLGKLKQMIRALQLELRLSKHEILTLYLDRAPFGGNIEGVEAASWAYLGKSAAKLSRAEAALLAVLPQAPSRLRPDRHAAAARAARDKVLARLRDLGTWNADALAEAQLEPVAARRLRAPMRAALLAERLRAERPGEPVIATTIDAPLQAASEARLSRYVEPLPERTSAAVLVIENRTRAVVAYAGSARFGDATRLGHVDMVRATRSPGSTLKPFLYAIALDDGLIHSESLLVDAPQDFDGYRPANFGDHFNGPVGAATALRLSLNVPAVELLARVTPRRFAARLAHGGLALELPRGAEPNLALILGGAGTSLEQLVAMYAAFADAGRTRGLQYLAAPRIAAEAAPTIPATRIAAAIEAAEAPTSVTEVAGVGGASAPTPVTGAVGAGGASAPTPVAGAVGVGGASAPTPVTGAVGVGGASAPTAVTGAVGVGGASAPTPAAEASTARVLSSEGAAFIVRSMLEAHPRPGDAIQGLDLSARRRLAWKTGTSYGHRDSWAIGVTPAYTIGVWVGRPDGTPLPGHYGAATAAPLLFALVDALPRHEDDARIAVAPASVALREICWPLGRAADDTAPSSCHEKREAWILDGSVPPTFAPWAAHGDEALASSWLRDRSSGLRVRADCASGAPEPVEHARWPALAEPWLDAGRRARQQPPAWAPACRVALSPHRALRIAGLDAGTTIAPPSNVSRIPSVSVRALGAAGEVSWLLDGRLVARSRGDASLDLALEQAGERVLVAVDSEGRYDRVAVRVLR